MLTLTLLKNSILAQILLLDESFISLDHVDAYLCMTLAPFALHRASSLFIVIMSGKRRGKQKAPTIDLLGSHFLLVLAESRLRMHWLPSDQLVDYINTTYHIEDDVKYTNQLMTTYLSKYYDSKSVEPNRVTLSSGVSLDVYRCACQCGGRRHNLLYIAESGSEVPVFPKVTNIASWLESKVTKRLLAGRQGQRMESRNWRQIKEAKGGAYRGPRQQSNTTTATI